MKEKSLIKTHSIYGYLLLKGALALMAILVVQAIFIIANHDIFVVEGSSAWLKLIGGNLVFGLASVAALFLPYFLLMLIPGNIRWKRWYRVMCEIVYYICMLLMVVPAVVDAGYYPHTYRLITADIFNYLTVGGQMGTLTWMFLADWWPLTLSGVLLLILMLLLGIKIKLPQRDSWRSHTINDLVGSAVSLAVLFVMLRGGFGKAITLEDAARYVEPKNSALVLNSTYCVARTSLISELPEKDYMTDAEMLQHFNPMFKPTAASDADTIDNGWFPGAGYHALTRTITVGDSTMNVTTKTYKNIVVVVLESFSQEYMGAYGAEKSYTPFLDSLAQHSLIYDGRSNGKKSIEGIPAITGSMPTLTYTPYILSKYYDSAAVALPTILKRHGYRTSFCHGTYNGVMDFDRYCRHAGFDTYLGKDEYMADGHGTEADYDGAWGIFDEPFLKFTNRYYTTSQTPFFSMIFTVTSHHPFPLPEHLKSRFGDDSTHPLMKVVRYADYSIQQFFEEARGQEWFENTLFVFLGDHPGYSFSPQFADYDGMYRIPMIIYDPAHDFGGIRSNRIVQQTDVMPTLLDYLGLKDRCLCFGKSIFASPDDGYQVVFGNGYYLLNRNGDRAIIEGDYTSGTPENLDFLKAYIQAYTHTLKSIKQ